MRNLELLRDVECIEISMKEYSPDHAPLQQQKVEHTHALSLFLSLTHTFAQVHLFSRVAFVIMESY